MKRFVFIDTPDRVVKSLKVEYTKDVLKVSGLVFSPVYGVTHEHDPGIVGEIAENKDSPHVAPPHSFEPAIHAGNLTNTYEEKDVPFEMTIRWADISGKPGFADYTQFALEVHQHNGTLELLETFHKSKALKDHSAAMQPHHHYPLRIFVPCARAQSFDDCLVIAEAPGAGFSATGCTFDTFDAATPYRGQNHPTLSIAGASNVIAAGGRFVVSYQWPDGTGIVGAEVHSEVTAGYVNRQRIHTDGAGKAYFTVLPLALDTGEHFRLKFGFKHYTGKVETTLVVS
jgi:hypothetical protein